MRLKLCFLRYTCSNFFFLRAMSQHSTRDTILRQSASFLIEIYALCLSFQGHDLGTTVGKIPADEVLIRIAKGLLNMASS